MKQTLLILLGALVAGGWVALHLVWGGLSLMANLMANDSGAASSGSHMMLILGMLAGQVLSGAAGVPAGLAFAWAGRRKLLAGVAAGLLVVGAALQAGVFYLFFRSAA